MTSRPFVPARMAGYRKLLAFALSLLAVAILRAVDALDVTTAGAIGGLFLTYVGGNIREMAHRAIAAPPAAAGHEVVAPEAPPAPSQTPRSGLGPVDGDTLLAALADVLAARKAAP